MNGQRLALALVLLIAAAATDLADLRAQVATVPGTVAESPLQFRRIFVPADRPSEWPTGSAKYLPIDVGTFEKLLRGAQANPPGGLDPNAPRIATTDYQGSLVGEDLLVGRASLEVQQPAERTGLLVLDPMSLAIKSSTWIDPQGPAVLGVGPDGRLGVLVERTSANLQLAWSLRGQRNAAGAVTFRLDLPASPVNRITLDLPIRSVLLSDQGLPTIVEGGSKNTRRWQVQLAGHTHVSLRIAAEDAASRGRQLTLLRQSVTYEFSPRGVDVLAQLRMDVHGEPISRIPITLDPTVQLVAVRYGETTVPWTLAAVAANQPTRAVLELPTPIAGLGRVLRISAIAPLKSDQRWRLPGIRPEGMFWQEGTATLVISQPLMLQQIATKGCRQAKTTPLAAPSSGETIDLQYYGADATIDLIVGRPRERFKVDAGFRVQLNPGEVSAETVAELSLRQAEQYVVRAEVGPGWHVDSVEAAQAEDLLDWNVETAESKSQRMVIRLGKAVSPKNPLRLMIASHRALEAGEEFAPDDLRPLSFSNALSGRQLMAVTAAEPYELDAHGAEELTLLIPNQLSPADSQLFATPPQGLTFVLDEGASRLEVALASRRPHYSADLRIEASVEGGSLAETCTIQCSPVAARVDRLLVQFAPARESPWQWTLAGAPPEQLAARRLASDDPRAAPGVELWELTLRSPRTEPFTLRAARTVPLSAEQPLALASVPDAASQRGTLSIHVHGEQGVSIKNRRLQGIPLEGAAQGQRTSERAAFRYVPLRDTAGPETVVSLTPPANAQATAGAWAWSCHLVSRYSEASAAIHQATYHIQTASRERISFTLPQGARLRSAAVDGAPLSHEFIAGTGQRFAIDLPANSALATIGLEFATEAALPRLVRLLAAPLPEADLPVLASRWTVWLPPGYAIVDSDPLWNDSGAASLTWRQRLFGPLGRGATDPGLNPFAGDNEARAAGPSVVESARESQLNQFAAALGSAALSVRAASGEASWGQLLSPVQAELDKSSVTLLVDRAGLAEIDFTSRTRFQRAAGSSSVERGIALLKQAHLLLLSRGDGLVLTSASHGARLQEQLTAPQRGVLCGVLPGSLAGQVEQAAQVGDSSNFVSFETWQALPDEAPLPWSLPVELDDPLVDARGWNSYSVELNDPSLAGSRVVRSAAVYSLGWVLFLAIVTISAWIGTRCRLPLLALAGLLGAAALVAPAAYTPLLAAALLGALCGLAWLTTARSVVAAAGSESQVSSTRLAPAVQAVSFLLAGSIVLLGVSIGWTQVASDAPTAANAKGAKIHTVLVPIDHKQQPVGGKYYVPEPMFNELYRTSAVSDRPTPWLIERAAYQGRLVREDLEKELTVADFQASFDLRVFEPDSRVRIPLSREGVTVPEGGVKLDGRTVEAQWEGAGGGLMVVVQQPGQCRLDVTLVPAVQTFGTNIGFDLGIPALAASTLELDLPAEINVETPAARGQFTWSKKRDRLTTQLGPTNRLVVRWPTGGSADGGAANLDVDELLWVKVQPGSMVVDARFKFRVIEGRVRQVRLLVDPRLRLLPSASADSLIAAIHTQPGTPETIELELSRPVSDQVTVDLAFLLTGSSGVGNLRLPRLEASGARASRRWLAVSVDPALEYSEKTTSGLKPLAVPDFLALWGAGEVKPQVAYSLPRGEPNWVLSTRPREAITSVAQSLAVSVGRGSAAVYFDALLDTSSGSNFQLQMATPPALEIDSLSVLEDGAQRVARWSQDDAGLVTVFFAGPVSGRQQLALRGRLSAPRRGQLSLASIQVLGSLVTQHRFLVFRQPPALVEVEHLAGMKSVDAAPADLNRAVPGRLVGSYEVEVPRGTTTLLLAPNVPQVQGTQVTTLELIGGVWTAAVDCDVHVTKGIVDALRFELPPQWTEPFELDRPASLEIVGAAGGPRELIVRPTAPISDSYRIKIEGRVAVAAGGRLRVPDVAPLDRARLNRFVVLPVQVELQQAMWDVVGLKTAPLPAESSKLPFSAESVTAYRVVEKRFQAELRPHDRTTGVARLDLADITLAWQADDHVYGVAAFDLDPSGAASCTLQMPAEHRLIHVAIEGRPALLSPAAPDRWRIDLPSRRLPQRIEVIFTGSPSGGWEGQQRRLEAPTLVDLDVGRTLWTIYAPPQAGPGEPSGGRGEIGATAQELLRLKSVAATIDGAAALGGDLTSEEVTRWYPAWEQRFSSSHGALRAAALLGNTVDGGAASEQAQARNVVKQHALAAKRLAAQLPGPGARASTLTTAPIDLLAESRLGQSPVRCMFRGAARPVRIDYPQREVGDLSERVVWAVLLTIGTILLVVSLRGRTWPTLSPFTTGALAGLLGWLVLAPSGVGFVLMVACALGRLREYWIHST